MDKPFQAPQGRLLPTIVLFVFVLGLLYTLFLLFQSWSLNRSLAKIEEQMSELELSTETLRSDQIEELYVAKQLQDGVEAAQIYWSQVIKKLQDIAPVTVFFSSYSGGEDGAIQISGLGDSYGSVADVIASMDESEDFSDVFVPSVTLGSTSDGQEVVSFSLQVQSKL